MWFRRYGQAEIARCPGRRRSTINRQCKRNCNSWERGTNENINGLLRQYLPKATDLAKVTDRQLQAHVRALNHRPRKCLGFQSPFEVFHPRPPG